ncbi:MAG: ClpXP protease specificity-enhancing factor [Methylotenera sp.]|nr:ClpXP protease specificity-enhancing factor [Methylotenera sp.]
MDNLISTKPYLIRAIHEWCVDNNLTPHLMVVVNSQTRVPMAYVKAGEIVLNINYGATKDLHVDNEAVVFSARFGGVSQSLYIPISAVKGIFARENDQGMFFDVESQGAEEVQRAEIESNETAKQDKTKKPTLTIVK